MNIKASRKKGPAIHWANIVEAGSEFGIRLFLWIFRVFGERFCRLAVWPVAIYYFLRQSVARRASIEYLEQLYKFDATALSSSPRIRDGVRHFAHFVHAVIDKAAVWETTLPDLDLDIKNYDIFHEVVRQRGGKLLIGSHFGNLEYCRGFSRLEDDIVINVLVHDRHAARFAEFMNKVSPLSGLNLYQVTEIDVSMILTLQAAIRRGEMVVIAADRIPVAKDVRTTTVSFLGRDARFPIGPYILAATLACPVYFLFAYRLNKKLIVSFEKLSERVVINRRHREEDLNRYADSFVRRLEHHCREAPFEWFNFYPFWQTGEFYES